MNYIEFLAFKNKILKERPELINLSENDLYNYKISEIKYNGSGHINGIVYRCHLVEDWLKYYNLSQDLKKHIGVSNGVRHSIETIFSQLKNKKFIIPIDVYPFYQKTCNDNNINYSEYKTLGVESLFVDINNMKGDVLLITDPIKPLGRDINESEYKTIKNWLKVDKSRILMVDCVYMINNELNPFLFDLYENTKQVILMYSLAKSWCLPNHFGITLFPKNEFGQSLREVYKTLEKNQDKLNLAYMALNKYKDFPENLKNIFKLKRLEVDNLLLLNIKQSECNPSYLFYTEQGFEELLKKGILTIPASVFGSKKGSIISVLI